MENFRINFLHMKYFPYILLRFSLAGKWFRFLFSCFDSLLLPRIWKMWKYDIYLDLFDLDLLFDGVIESLILLRRYRVRFTSFLWRRRIFYWICDKVEDFWWFSFFSVGIWGVGWESVGKVIIIFWLLDLWNNFNKFLINWWGSGFYNNYLTFILFILVGFWREI